MHMQNCLPKEESNNCYYDGCLIKNYRLKERHRHIMCNSQSIRLPRLFHDTHILNCALTSNNQKRTHGCICPADALQTLGYLADFLRSADRPSISYPISNTDHNINHTMQGFTIHLLSSFVLFTLLVIHQKLFPS